MGGEERGKGTPGMQLWYGEGHGKGVRDFTKTRYAGDPRVLSGVAVQQQGLS